MLVVLAIITTLTGVVLTNQTSFNKTLVLANTAYDIALTLRSSQTYGLGSRAFGGVVNAGYGLHFETVSPRSFTLFSDIYPNSSPSFCYGVPAVAGSPGAKPGNCRYDPSESERVKEYVVENNIEIYDFCAYLPGNRSCARSNGLSSLDIVFARPNPSPFINAYAGEACITISSPQGTFRFISVSASGQINANAASCPSP